MDTRFLAETYFNGSAKQVSADVASSNIKSRNLSDNVETGLKMLLSSAILFRTLVMSNVDVLLRFLIGLRSVTIIAKTP